MKFDDDFSQLFDELECAINYESKANNKIYNELLNIIDERIIDIRVLVEGVSGSS